MTENLTNQKIREHNELNKQLALSEEAEYWQDKLLQIKLSKVKEDFEYNKKFKKVESRLDHVKTRNNSLKEEVNEINRLLTVLQSDDQSNKSKLSEIREEIRQLESRNSELFNESCEKYNYMRTMHQNPDYLLNHVLKFDHETLKNLCIRLNKLGEEKVHQIMKMQQQQFYNQMMMSQGPVFIPQGVPVNMPPNFYPDDNQGETKFEENTN